MKTVVKKLSMAMVGLAMLGGGLYAIGGKDIIVFAAVWGSAIGVASVGLWLILKSIGVYQ